MRELERATTPRVTDIDDESRQARLRHLSPRENEILRGLVSGKRLPTIADDLGISPHTAKNHLKRVFRKLRVSSQVELLACFSRLVDP